MIDGEQRKTAVAAVSTALVGYAAFMFVGALRDRRRGRRAVPDTAAATSSTRETEQSTTELNTTELNTAEPSTAEPDAPERAPAGPGQRIALVTGLVVLATLLLLTWRRLRR